MSLLDEIEKRAQRNNDKQAVADAASRAQDEVNLQRIRPVLQKIDTYFRRAADALNDSDEQASVNFAIRELGELKDLRQGKYRVSVDAEHDDAVRFAFECLGKRALKGIVANDAIAKSCEKDFLAAGLNFRRAAPTGGKPTLIVEPRVHVSLSFRRAEASVEMRTRNLLAIESRSYVLTPEGVNNEFLEALLEIVLRRGNRLSELIGDVVSESRRNELRKELARQERRRHAEVSGLMSRAIFPITEAFRRFILRE